MYIHEDGMCSHCTRKLSIGMQPVSFLVNDNHKPIHWGVSCVDIYEW